MQKLRFQCFICLLGIFISTIVQANQCPAGSTLLDTRHLVIPNNGSALSLGIENNNHQINILTISGAVEYDCAEGCLVDAHCTIHNDERGTVEHDHIKFSNGGSFHEPGVGCRSDKTYSMSFYGWGPEGIYIYDKKYEDNSGNHELTITSCQTNITQEDINRADETTTCTDNPVNIATGNKFFNINDYIDSNNPLLQVSRSYDSTDGEWIFNQSISASYFSETDSYLLSFANGSKGTFVKQGNKWVRYENHIQDYLTAATSGEVTYRTTGDYQATFDSSGKVIREQKSNYSVTYAYAPNGDTTISDLLRNRVLTISYDQTANISLISLPNQKLINYLYDDNGRLLSINNQGKETTYLYEESALPNAITKVIDGNNKTYKEISYYVDGRVKSSSLNADNEITSFSYPANNTTTTINPLGKQTTYNFIDIKGVKKIETVEGIASTSCLAANQNYEYYPDGQIQSKTDWKGIKTEFVYNERGLEIQRTEAVGTTEQRVISTTWHESLNLPITMTIGNKITTYDYDAKGLLIAKKESTI